MHLETTLYKKLDNLSITYNTIEHEPFFTVEQARAFREKSDAGHTKNLFLKDDRRQFWLIVAHADTAIPLRILAKNLPAKNLRFAQPELLMEVLGVIPGSVSPFALLNDIDQKVRVIIDQKLYSFDAVGFHPLRNTATTVINPRDLDRFIEQIGNYYTVIDFKQYKG